MLKGPPLLPVSSALAALEAMDAQVVEDPVEGLEARLATLREGIVDIPTTEAAVERAQVSTFHAIAWYSSYAQLIRKNLPFE